MILDKLLEFSDGQDLLQSQGSFYSSNAIDLSTTLGDPGAGNPLAVVIVVDTAFTSSASTGTVVFAVIDEENATLDSGSIVIVQTAPYIVTSLTLGKIIVILIPAGLITQQFLGMKYTIGTDDTTAGTVTAHLAMPGGAQTNI